MFHRSFSVAEASSLALRSHHARRAPFALFVAALVLSPALASTAEAALVATYDVGSGANTSHVQFDFSNGNTYLYNISYEGATTGQGLFLIIVAAQPGLFDYSTVSFPFGDALYSVAIGADADAGFGTPPLYLDYWHYWTKPDAAARWDISFVGFDQRIVTNGSWDGWVFGSDGPPSAVPATPALVPLALASLVLRRRRRPR